MNVQSSKNVESKSENSNEHENLRAHVVSTGDLQVAAVFPSKRKVQEVLEIVQDQTSVEVSQVEIIEAGDPKMSENLNVTAHPLAKACGRPTCCLVQSA